VRRALRRSGASQRRVRRDRTSRADLYVAPRDAAIAVPHAPFDVVVVLLMENRSFDHLLGWLPDADGKQAGLSFPDTKGVRHATYRLSSRGMRRSSQGRDLTLMSRDRVATRRAAEL